MIDYTKEEKDMIKNYATKKTGFKSGKKWRAMVCETSIKIIQLVEIFGDDNGKTKPEAMNRIEYWLGHIEN